MRTTQPPAVIHSLCHSCELQHPLCRDTVLSDPALKEYLVWLDKQPKSQHFIISELDSTHLFVLNSPDIAAYLQRELDLWHDRNSYSEEVLEEAESGGQLPSGKVAGIRK